MRTLTDEEKERLMDELIQSINDEHTQHSYEFTVQEFAERCHRSYGWAKRFLAQQIADEKMAKRRISVDGKTFVVYSMI